MGQDGKHQWAKDQTMEHILWSKIQKYCSAFTLLAGLYSVGYGIFNNRNYVIAGGAISVISIAAYKRNHLRSVAYQALLDSPETLERISSTLEDTNNRLDGLLSNLDKESAENIKSTILEDYM